jgi:hypothetical protein
MIVPLASRTSKHDVLPPYRELRRSGVGVEPRTPQNLILIPYRQGRTASGAATRPQGPEPHLLSWSGFPLSSPTD